MPRQDFPSGLDPQTGGAAATGGAPVELEVSAAVAAATSIVPLFTRSPRIFIDAPLEPIRSCRSLTTPTEPSVANASPVEATIAATAKAMAEVLEEMP